MATRKSKSAAPVKSTVQAQIDKALANIKKNVAKKAKAAPKPKQPEQQLSLPLWPEAVRGVPNAVLRGALFTVSKERAHFRELTQIAAVDGIEIRVKNDRLNQVDLDLWEMLLHLQREQPLGERVEFTAHAMLKALKRTTGGKDHDWLNNALARLIGSVVEIKWINERKAFAGALVASFFRDDDTGRYVVTFNRDMMKLYAQGHTWIDWEQRQALGQNNLAKWLHGFYSTHAEPFAYKVATLHQLCGSEDKSLRSYRQKLKRALDELQSMGAIKGWRIDADDLVHIDRKPSNSQRKYLAKAS